MAKSKKNRQKDFQKVKLKIGKKLPKGLNVTDTSFKSKGIHIKEQLKHGNSTEPTTKRKHNIKDLLSHLQHYNVSMKHDAVVGLKDLLTSNPELLQRHLVVILERSCALFVDKDHAIRQAVVRLHRVVFPRLSATEIAPFFSIMSAHLCCAMTHIQEDVQLDSLAVFDSYLEHFPQLITSVSNSLMQNFLDQISVKGQSGGGSKGLGSRSLSVSPHSELSTQKWRSSVLGRLHQFLEATLKHHILKSEAGRSAKVVDCTQEVPVHQAIYKTRTDLPGFRLCQLGSRGMSTSGQGETASNPNEGSDIGKYICTLTPLLLECWVESAPGESTAGVPGNSVSPMSVVTMTNILNVIKLMWTCLEKSSPQNDEHNLVQALSKKFLGEFVTYFLPSFPYSLHYARTKGNKKRKLDTSQVSVIGLNLSVCDVMILLLGDTFDPDLHSNQYQFIVEYLLNIVQQLSLDRSHRLQAMATVGRLMSMKSVSEEITLKILNAIQCLYEACDYRSADKVACLQFLDEIVFGKTSRREYLRLPIVQSWLSSLPNMLIRVLSSHNERIVSVILSCIKKSVIILPGELGLSESILEQLFGINSFPQLSDVNQRVLIEIVYYIPKLSMAFYKLVAALCRSSVIEGATIRYIISVLLSRLKAENDRESLVQSLSFMFSLVLGKLDLAKEFHGDEHYFMIGDAKTCQQQILLSDIAIEYSKQLLSGMNPWNVSLKVLEDILNFKTTPLPLHVIKGACLVVSDMHPADMPADILTRLGAFCARALDSVDYLEEMASKIVSGEGCLAGLFGDYTDSLTHTELVRGLLRTVKASVRDLMIEIPSLFDEVSKRRAYEEIV